MYLSRFCRDESLSSPRERYGRASLSNRGVKQLKGPWRITGDSCIKKKAGGQTEVNFSCTCAHTHLHTQICRHILTHPHTVIHSLTHTYIHSHTHIHTHTRMAAPTSPPHTEASAPLVGSSLITIIWLLLGKEQSSPELYRAVKGQSVESLLLLLGFFGY